MPPTLPLDPSLPLSVKSLHPSAPIFRLFPFHAPLPLPPQFQGPSAALFLRRNGVHVDVFEKRDKPMGVVTYVIPEFRIATKMIERDYNLAVSAGVNFHFGVEDDFDVNEIAGEKKKIKRFLKSDSSALVKKGLAIHAPYSVHPDLIIF